MQTAPVSALVLAAALAIAVLGEAAAAPPLNKPVKHCHYEANCVTKYRTCPPKPTAKPGGPPSTVQRPPPCTPGPYQSCSGKKLVCPDDD